MAHLGRLQGGEAPPPALPRPGRHQGALAGQTMDDGRKRHRLRQARAGLDQHHAGLLHGVVGVRLIAQDPLRLHVQARQQGSQVAIKVGGVTALQPGAM